MKTVNGPECNAVYESKMTIYVEDKGPKEITEFVTCGGYLDTIMLEGLAYGCETYISFYICNKCGAIKAKDY